MIPKYFWSQQTISFNDIKNIYIFGNMYLVQIFVTGFCLLLKENFNFFGEKRYKLKK